MMIDCTEGTHVIGSRVVESILQLYPAPLSRALKAEFYGQVSSCDDHGDDDNIMVVVMMMMMVIMVMMMMMLN